MAARDLAGYLLSGLSAVSNVARFIGSPGEAIKVKASVLTVGHALAVSELVST